LRRLSLTLSATSGLSCPGQNHSEQNRSTTNRYAGWKSLHLPFSCSKNNSAPG
jgi:hypothetical protein